MVKLQSEGIFNVAQRNLKKLYSQSVSRTMAAFLHVFSHFSKK